MRVVVLVLVVVAVAVVVAVVVVVMVAGGDGAAAVAVAAVVAALPDFWIIVQNPNLILKLTGSKLQTSSILRLEIFMTLADILC